MRFFGANRVARVVLDRRGMHAQRAIVALSVVVSALALGIAAAQDWHLPLTSTSGLVPHGVRASAVTHNGHQATRLVEEPGVTSEGYALVPGPLLQDGAIEVELAGRPGEGAGEGARGFIGI